MLSFLPYHGKVDALRLRLEEKEATLNKKSKQIQEMSEEKGTLNGEIHDLKDMLEVKERKVNVLQKKVIWTRSWKKDHALCEITLKMRDVAVHFEHVCSADWEPAGAAEGQGEADEQP